MEPQESHGAAVPSQRSDAPPPVDPTCARTYSPPPYDPEVPPPPPPPESDSESESESEQPPPPPPPPPPEAEEEQPPPPPPQLPPRTLEDIPISERQVVLCQYVVRRFLRRMQAERHARQRLRVVNELLTTERTYVGLLNILLKHYYVPLKLASDSPTAAILTDQDLGAIFSNLPDFAKLNQQLLKELEQRVPNFGSSSCIGDVWRKIGPYLKLYTTYCANHNAAIEALQKKKATKPAFAAFLKKAEAAYPEQTLNSLLILPVQRIPRYQLLFQELVKLTPSGHPDTHNLIKSLEGIVKVATHINQYIKEKEVGERLIILQKMFVGYCPPLFLPKRQLLFEGQLAEVCKKVPKSRYFFLLTDCLLCATRLEQSQYKFRKQVALLDASLTPLDDSAKIKFGFELATKEKLFTLCAKDATERVIWVGKLHTVITELAKGAPAAASATAGPPNTYTATVPATEVADDVVSRQERRRSVALPSCRSEEDIAPTPRGASLSPSPSSEPLDHRAAFRKRRFSWSPSQAAGANAATWTAKEVLQWLCTLEGGRFSDYKTKFKNMTGAELLLFNCELLKLFLSGGNSNGNGSSSNNNGSGVAEDAASLYAHLQKMRADAAVPDLSPRCVADSAPPMPPITPPPEPLPPYIQPPPPDVQPPPPDVQPPPPDIQPPPADIQPPPPEIQPPCTPPPPSVSPVTTAHRESPPPSVPQALIAPPPLLPDEEPPPPPPSEDEEQPPPPPEDEQLDKQSTPPPEDEPQSPPPPAEKQLPPPLPPRD
eukprot:TRINITY_DN2141_c1_g1_i1.p1 TRINITY_DN2141_c1_g1~~TRINITY_DN2141_c1_g1_i1.p1  ORF type:complete len:793 (-),score=219.14 TRINITY_DN2141_c1_g1_i1:1152-3464(-)